MLASYSATQKRESLRVPLRRAWRRSSGGERCLRRSHSPGDGAGKTRARGDGDALQRALAPKFSPTEKPYYFEHPPLLHSISSFQYRRKSASAFRQSLAESRLDLSEHSSSNDYFNPATYHDCQSSNFYHHFAKSEQQLHFHEIMKPLNTASRIHPPFMSILKRLFLTKRGRPVSRAIRQPTMTLSNSSFFSRLNKHYQATTSGEHCTLAASIFVPSPLLNAEFANHRNTTWSF